MKIDEYYQNVARINLNGSLLALIPAILIVGGNLVFFQHKQIMLLVIPFLLYSIFNFQLYIRKMNQAMLITKKLPESKQFYPSILSSECFLLYFYNTLSPKLLIFYPDGYAAGVIKKYRVSSIRYTKIFALYDVHDELICFFKVQGKELLKIEVYSKDREYIGCLEKSNQFFSKKSRKELLNREGRFLAAIEGSMFYMDEQVVNSKNLQVGRLQRGWIPVEWSNYIIDPNTPVLSFSKGMSENDKLLQLSILIDEFFLKR